MIRTVAVFGVSIFPSNSDQEVCQSALLLVGQTMPVFANADTDFWRNKKDVRGWLPAEAETVLDFIIKEKLTKKED